MRAASTQRPHQSRVSQQHRLPWATWGTRGARIPRQGRLRNLAAARAPPLVAQHAASGCGPRGAPPEHAVGEVYMSPAGGSKEGRRAVVLHAMQTLFYLLISYRKAHL